MWMTANDIVGSVHRNGGEWKQLKVLADINACSVEDIEKVLEENGYEKVSGEWKRKKMDPVVVERKKDAVEDGHVLVQMGTILPDNHHVVIKP